MDLPFSLSEPQALLLLLTIPPVVALGVLSARARPRDRGRIAISTVIRSFILLLIVLALAGFQWISAGGPLNVVFLVDESASVSQASTDAAGHYVQQAIAAMGPDDRAGVVLFGETAVVDRALSASSDWKPFGQHPARLATNIADAIQVGSALFPEGGSRRLVLLSDGAETVGKAREAAGRNSAAGIQLSVVPLGLASHNEVAIDKVTSPASLPKGQQMDVTVLLKSTSDRTATVRLFDASDPAGEQNVQLKTGNNAVTFKVKAAVEGFHVFRAHVDAVDDQYAENNEATSFTMVSRPASVLIVAGTPDDGAPLKTALAAAGVDATVIPPPGLPRSTQDLAPYDVVVLANVSAQALGAEGQDTLQQFVRDDGHGLIMLGGELSYGAGGYLRSPLEEVLPVTMDVRTSEQRASLAMSFVVDKSGSMGKCHCGGAQKFDPSMRTEFGPSKIEIAKQAVAKATAILNSSDQVGVVGFDLGSHELVNLQPVGNLGANGMTRYLQPVQAEGESNLHGGLQTAISDLMNANAQLKHIILVSDGWTQQGQFSDLLAQMAKNNITLSVVGAGEGSGAILKELADKGGGRYYPAEDVQAVPDIFLRETVRLVGSYYVEQPFKPLVVKQSPILRGLPVEELPQLLGYNGTTAKPSAEVILKSPRGDPVLAQWQYGLGHAIAWTPDVKGRWATDWVKWPTFPQFAGQMVSWALPQDTSQGLQARFDPVAGSSSASQDVAVRIESTDPTGAPRNFLVTSVTLTATVPLGTSQPIGRDFTASMTAPGLYSAVAKDLQQGTYAVRVDQHEPSTGKLVTSQETGVVVPYPSEYRLIDDQASLSKALLGDLAQLGGGRQLDMAQPASVWTHDIAAQPQRVPLWPWLLTLAILLFPLDVAIRRLSMSRRDLWRVLRGMRGSEA